MLRFNLKLAWDALCEILLHEAVFQFSVEYTCRKMIMLGMFMHTLTVTSVCSVRLRC